MRILILPIIIAIITEITCNLWDNMFTNNRGPVILPYVTEKLYFNKTIESKDSKGKIIRKNINVFTVSYHVYMNVMKLSINNKISKDGLVTQANEQHIIDFNYGKLYNIKDNNCTYLKSLEKYISFFTFIFTYQNYNMYTFFNETTTPYYEFYIQKPKISEVKENSFLNQIEINEPDRAAYLLAYEMLKPLAFNLLDENLSKNNNDFSSLNSDSIRYLESQYIQPGFLNVLDSLNEKYETTAKEDSFVTFYFDKKTRSLRMADVFIDKNNPYYQKLQVNAIFQFDVVELQLPDKDKCTNVY